MILIVLLVGIGIVISAMAYHDYHEPDADKHFFRSWF